MRGGLRVLPYMSAMAINARFLWPRKHDDGSVRSMGPCTLSSIPTLCASHDADSASEADSAFIALTIIRYLRSTCAEEFCYFLLLPTCLV